MYHVSAQGVDERMINVHYYYHHISTSALSIDQIDQRLEKRGVDTVFISLFFQTRHGSRNYHPELDSKS